MSAILIIYTGGTIGMMEDVATGSLIPFDFGQLQSNVPELQRFKSRIDSISFDRPIDSSEVSVDSWQKMVEIIWQQYEAYDGFVILHGTDTMAYSASALSFMLDNLSKPVIFTGSQLPIGRVRTDGKENLITAIEIASACKNGGPLVREVCIYFQSQLFRGNRTHKYNTENFDAFESANLAPLAEAGIHISYRHDLLIDPNGTFRTHLNMDNNVAVLRLFPGLGVHVVNSILNAPDLKAVILESYGSGNAMREKWFIDALEAAILKGITVLNISQCNKGFVEQGRYETSSDLRRIGVVGGADMTTEAAITKMMHLLGRGLSVKELRDSLCSDLRGELTTSSHL